MRVLPEIMEKIGLELTDKERMKLISGLPVDGELERGLGSLGLWEGFLFIYLVLKILYE